MSVNLGVIIASFVAGVISYHLGYAFTFIIGGIFIFLGYFFFRILT